MSRVFAWRNTWWKGREKMKHKLQIAILFGGCSPEYSVSPESAYAVICHLDQKRFAPVLIGISSDGQWFHFTGDAQKIVEDRWLDPAFCFPAVVSPNRNSHELLVLVGQDVRSIRIDAAFPILHGKNGEDGTVQCVFELSNIPVVGCGVLSSALCMDKDRAHKLAQAAGVTVPASYVLQKDSDVEKALAWAEELGYPLFVKPVKAGSSYGITKVAQRGQLPAAFKLAFDYDNEIILEECISGFEVGCAVLGNNSLTIGGPDEIELSSGFFDFTEKYTLKTSAIHVPARISEAKADAVRETAKRIYKTLGCRGFARVDMFLEPTGRIVFNEVNTIPGFTAHSRYPSMMKAAGMSFEAVISAVIDLAVGE